MRKILKYAFITSAVSMVVACSNSDSNHKVGGPESAGGNDAGSSGDALHQPGAQETSVPAIAANLQASPEKDSPTEVSEQAVNIPATTAAMTAPIRTSLVRSSAWLAQTSTQDTQAQHRPELVDCPRGEAWFLEEGELEVKTGSCNYLSLVQPGLSSIVAGDKINVTLSHSRLSFSDAANAHASLSIGGNLVFETLVEIPSDSGIINETFTMDVDVALGSNIEFHLHNHGSNSWKLHDIALITSRGEVRVEAADFESTFAAIQSVVFEGAGCTQSSCHGDAASGGLNLLPQVAYANLVDVPSKSSDYKLVNPTAPSLSLLYRKMAAKFEPARYPISGLPMPVSGSITEGQLEAVRIWIELGAPETGSVGDLIGRGESEIENLLGVSLPSANAIGTVPLAKPNADEGLQMAMPPHEIKASSEHEYCFAQYFDLRGIIPEQYMNENRSKFYVNGGDYRADPFTHHNVPIYSGLDAESVHDPVFGEWRCAGGDNADLLCEPTDLSYCGTGVCRTRLLDNIGCIGYGPGGGRGASNPRNNFVPGLPREGFYLELPTHGILYWNSHSFNLTDEDAMHRVWWNFLYAEDRRFNQKSFQDISQIGIAAGTPPYSKASFCHEYTFEQGDKLLLISSHTHKRGERFTVARKNGDIFYESFDYDEPLMKIFEDPLTFDASNPDDRTLEYCADYNNGVKPDGTPDPATVTRYSRKPARSTCYPVACTDGQIGASCNGPNDHASCDSVLGAADGFCDACPITAGVTSDDEMFMIFGTLLEEENR